MFIQTEATPNPDTIKFLPGVSVLDHDTRDFPDRQSAHRSPLVERLFAIEAVARVFLGSDFISVTKGKGEWLQLKPLVLGAIMEHYLSGQPVLVAENGAKADNSLEFFEQEDSETVAAIRQLINTRVRPAVARDGGDIIFRGFKDGVVFLHLRGACAGCPSATITLRNGIENLLRHFIPEVVRVAEMAAPNGQQPNIQPHGSHP